MVNSGCYNFKRKCDKQKVCEQSRTSARPILNARRDGRVSNDRFTLRKAMGYSFLPCTFHGAKECKPGEQMYHPDENVIIKYKKTTPFRVKEGLVPLCGPKSEPRVCTSKESKRRSMGNQKFVYDSSDYIKFKRLSAKNKNYGDCSFGGDDNKGAQSAMRRRR